MNTPRAAWFWLVVSGLFCLALFLIHTILLPFIAGLLIAYFLDPMADRMQRHMSRGVASIMLIILFFACFIVGLSLLAPPIYEQSLQLAAKLPSYVAHNHQKAESAVRQALASLSEAQLHDIQASFEAAAKNLLAKIPELLLGIWKSGMALVNLLSLLFVTPVVSFYLLREWDGMIRRFDDLLPRHYADAIREILHDINRTLAGYVRGQSTVCLILGAYYTFSLWLVGLKSALLVGVISGVLAFIPYVGVLVGMSLGLGAAYFQFGPGVELLVVLGIFALAQLVEGNVITPKLVGDRVGLHPVWLIFGLLAGGSLLGFTGVLLAVPVTAIIGVLVRHGVERYRGSGLYTGEYTGEYTGKTAARSKKGAA